MSEFFKSWRRQIGVLTLMLACVFAVGWLRSLYLVESIGVNCAKAKYQLRSFRGCLNLSRGPHDSDWKQWLRWSSLRINTGKYADADFRDWEEYEVLWRWDFMEFQFGSFLMPADFGKSPPVTIVSVR